MPILAAMRFDRVLEGIAAAFARAVEDGRFEEAEGWFAVARLASCRESDLPVPPPARLGGESTQAP
jgi:hypothetical protein